MWETLNYLAETRLKEGKKTIIISDSPRLYDEHGSLMVENIINLSPIMETKLINNTVTNVISNFTGSDDSGLFGD